MNVLLENWFFLLVALFFIGIHMFGHGHGHGHRGHDPDNAVLPQPGPRDGDSA